jgi:hypothetical protein
LPALSLGVSVNAWALRLMPDTMSRPRKGFFMARTQRPTTGIVSNCKRWAMAAAGHRAGFAPALIGHVADDQLRGVLLGGRHDLADAPQDKVHLRLVAGKEKPVGAIDALLQGVSLEYRRGVPQRITGKGNR